jgi:hypothetical protein
MKKLIFVIAAVALIASPALAVDWNFYGSARMATFYQSQDYGNGSGDLSGKGTVFNGNQKTDTQMQWEMQTNSRLGATVKAENISGRFEWGVDDGANNVSARRLYGVWDFGAAKLKVGKDYSPTSQFISTQAFDGDIGLLGRGTGYSSRNGQISLSFGGFEVALIDPKSAGILRNMTTGDVDEYIPKIEAGWGMSFDTWNFGVQGGFQYYEIENGGAANEDVDVTSWTLGGNAGVNFGPIYLKAAATVGTNWANAGWHISSNGAAYDGDDNTKDVDSWQVAGVVGWKFTDQLSFEFGTGYREDDSDLAGEDTDDNWESYINATVSLAPGVWLIPEIGYTDFGDDIEGSNEGDRYYVGAKWQIDF